MQLTLGQRLFRSFAILVAVVGVLIAFIGTYLINHTVVGEAQARVSRNLQTGRSIYDGHLHDLQCLADNLARDPRVAAITTHPEPAKSYAWWDGLCTSIRPDIFTITDAYGRVLLRVHAPGRTDDYLADDPLVERARSGLHVAGTVVWPLSRLARENGGLADRARITPVPTPQARPDTTHSPTDAMLIMAAAPVVGQDNVVLGTVELGILLNRHNDLVDNVKDIVFQDGQYAGKPLGTVTIFCHDVRVATNVRDAHGRRAIGTRVSESVYNKVVVDGQTWVDRAFVVDSWYLAAYEPIYDINENVAGILYVGLLEQKYRDMRVRTITWLLSITAIGLALSVALSYLLARRLAGPLHSLAQAAKAFSGGDLTHRVESTSHDDEEIAQLKTAFNQMADALAARQSQLQEANVALIEVNEQLGELNHHLGELNHNYLDMLGFVSHELKNPLSSCLLNAHSVSDEVLGDLNEHQKKAMASIVRNLEYFDEMIRHYLDLTRIEQGRMNVQPHDILLMEDVVGPVLEGLERQIQAQKVTIEKDWPKDDAHLKADPALMRIVYDNLLGNALNYGHEGGTIRLRATDKGEFYEFGVWNEGVGIPADRMSELFQKFHRIEQPTLPKRRGTGLGLFVTREIIERHGGTIRAESEQGRWVEFVFTLPKDGEARAEAK